MRIIGKSCFDSQAPTAWVLGGLSSDWKDGVGAQFPLKRLRFEINLRRDS